MSTAARDAVRCRTPATSLGRSRVPIREYEDRGVQVLAVDVEADETEADLAGFQSRVPGAAYFWAIDKTLAVTRAFQVRALDTTVVIDRQGRIVYRDEAPTNYATLKQAVERALP